jgi:hypothetical protein
MAHMGLRPWAAFLGLAGALVFGGPQAWAAACSTDTVANYEALASCSVGPVTFSNISVSTLVSGSGSVVLGDFTPFTTVVDGNTEYGLSLNYSSNTGSTAGSTADVAWTYNVSGTPNLEDAYMAFAGTTTGTGQATLAETLSNGVTLSLNAPGATDAVFAPVGSLSVIKDQNDFSGAAGSSNTSVLQNAFSVTTVPEPASLAILGSSLLGIGMIRRRRNS